jgi:AcrR family transcriptional regulator
MVTAVARNGFADTTIAQVVDLASVSRTTFYQHFQSKEDCFLETHDLIVQVGTERVAEAYRSSEDWLERLRAAFVAFVDLVCSEPDAANLVMVESLAAGSRARERREGAGRTFELMIRQSFDQAPGRRAHVSDLTIRAIVGGIRRVVYQHLRQGTAERLPGLVDDLLAWALSYRAADAKAPREPRPASEAGNGSARPSSATAPPFPDPARDRLTLSHRERIIQAVTSIVYEKGYPALTIPEISATAGISNQTFYENFPGKEQAVLAAFDDGAERALDVTTAAFDTAGSWELGVQSGLHALLEFLASEPMFGRLAFLDLLNAGRAAQGRSEAVLDRFGALLGPGFDMRPDTPREVADTIVGGIWTVAQHEIAHDRTAQLPKLAKCVTYIALAPFTGAGKAAEIARRQPGR